MRCEIINGRLEVDRMIEDIYGLPADGFSGYYIDYVDVCNLRGIGAFRQALCCHFDSSDENVFERVVAAVESMHLPADKLRGAILHFVVADCEGMSFDVLEMVSRLREWYVEMCRSVAIDPQVTFANCLADIYADKTMPRGDSMIQIMFSFEKTEQERFEDEAHIEAIRRYNDERRPIQTLTFESLGEKK